MTQCHFCGGQLIWGCDYDYSDYGLEGDGVNSEDIEDKEENNECK